jgi:hypothetical protein
VLTPAGWNRHHRNPVDRLEFPTTEQVDKASHEELARWYRFLLAQNDQQQKVVDKIAARFKKLGGMTDEVSRKIGHGGT